MPLRPRHWSRSAADIAAAGTSGETGRQHKDPEAQSQLSYVGAGHSRPISGRIAQQAHTAARALLAWSHTAATRTLASLRRPETLILIVILTLGALLRLYFLIRWRPALVGYPDSATYLQIAHTSIYANPFRPGGYGEFLRLLHDIRPYLRFAIAVQHLLGLGSGLLLFAAARRAGGPRWIGLVPAAVVILGGSEIFLEHAPLTESLFIFLVDVAIYAIVRSWRGNPAWSGLAGLALGVGNDVRAIGEAVLIVAIIAATFAPGPWRRRLLLGAVMLVAGAVPIGIYEHEHERVTGYGGMTGTGYFDLYARVAPFAECDKFHPPKDLRRLCIHVPVSQRQGHDYWEYLPESPAFATFGDPDVYVHPHEQEQLRQFAIDAILGQPLRYLEFVGRDVVRIVDPNYSSSPYASIGNAGYGNTPESLIDYYFSPRFAPNAELAIDGYYPGEPIVHHSIGLLLTWERDTRLVGPLMALLLALAALGPILCRGEPRRAAGLFLLMATVLLVAPILASEYDYRFCVPAFGAVGAAAAYGAYGLWLRLWPLRESVLRRLRPAGA